MHCYTLLKYDWTYKIEENNTLFVGGKDVLGSDKM